MNDRKRKLSESGWKNLETGSIRLFKSLSIKLCSWKEPGFQGETIPVVEMTIEYIFVTFVL